MYLEKKAVALPLDTTMESTTLFSRQSTNNSMPPLDPMTQLNKDADFHFEILRVLGLAPYEGADVGEVLVASNKIKPGDFESYAETFSTLATKTDKLAQSINKLKNKISARNAYFKAATYYRAADLFLHGNWDDPRITSLWKSHRIAFDNALQLMTIPGKRVTLPARCGDNFTIPIIFYSCGLPGPRPTILLGQGYDGAQEEMYHAVGAAALQRGYNVITYEGPGQPTVRREQNLGFISEWEKVVTPIVDYAVTLPEVDFDAIALMGYSLGGYFAPRAAAFEDRLAAVIAIDGIYDFGKTLIDPLKPEVKQLIASGNKEKFNEIMEKGLKNPKALTSVKWALQQGKWTFKAESWYDYFTEAQKYSLGDLTKKIQIPVFVGDAELDIFFPNQAKSLAEHLGDKATYVKFKAEDGAGAHCSIGAGVYLNQVMFDWLDGVLQNDS